MDIEAGQDDSFVSISLDGSECEICLQDTGEALTTCDVCARHLTSGPVQEGFNQIPDLIHTDTQAHRACFRKFHKLARRLVAADSAKQRGSPTGSPYHRDIYGNQWLNFNSNNLGSELLLENIRNRVSRSNPGSRRGSPVLTGGRLLDQERCRSEPKLDQSAEDLHRSYTKYLFGKQEDGSPHNRNLPEKLSPNLNAKLDDACQTNQVPEERSVTCCSNRVQSEECIARVTTESCQEQQYLEKMQTLTLKQCQELVRDTCRASKDRSKAMNISKCSKSRIDRRNNQSALKTENNGHLRIEQESKEKHRGSDHCRRTDEWWRDVQQLSEENCKYWGCIERHCSFA